MMVLVYAILRLIQALGEQKGHQIVYWNNTVFSLERELGFDDEVKIETIKPT
jgi:hypothetical protein